MFYFIPFQAKDFDKMGTLNSRVKYKIVEAVNNLTENFTIDEFRGEISLNGPLDYEGLDPDLNGKIIITVMAYDMGIPPMNSTTNVTVTVEVSTQTKLVKMESIYGGS